jgi:Fur family ferric uptake transcriptional regulator
MPSVSDVDPVTLAGTRERLHSRGLRWTPQRRAILEVLAATDGHITGVELVERCRVGDPETTTSTVYRTLDVLEQLGLVRHSHGHDGREEFHVLPETEHGHLVCESCGASSEIGSDAVRRLLEALEQQSGYRVDLNHLAIAGVCAACR